MALQIKTQWLFFLALVFSIVFLGQIDPVRERKITKASIFKPATPLPAKRCVDLPVIMLHHVEPEREGEQKNHQGLTIDTKQFQRMLDRLKEKGYISVTPEEIVAYFDESGLLPEKAIMLTFDDGYDDIWKYAYGILRETGFKGVTFVPTGLVGDKGYLTWENIMEMDSSGVMSFGNHTWSHKNAGRGLEIMRKEITVADIQLSDMGLNKERIFAYPYGESNDQTANLLQELGYKLAFTTAKGTSLCKSQRLTLPRIRQNSIEMVELLK